MAKVTNKDKYGNEMSLDQMLRKFKQQVAKDGTLEDLRKHEYFRSKATKRKEKMLRHQRLLKKFGN